jgi:hypothetical protein
MHYLSLIYFVSQPIHVSGMFIAHYQEGIHCICTALGTCYTHQLLYIYSEYLLRMDNKHARNI